MESFISNRIISYFSIIFFSLLATSCANETKEGPKKVYDEPIYKELLVTGENKSSFYLDGEVVSPENVEGYLKARDSLKQYTVTCYTGSEGYFFDLYVPEGAPLVGSHSLRANGNRLIINYKKDGLLTVYGTAFCQGNPGDIVIDKYDSNENSISGHFTVSACNYGMVGEAGNKTIHKCKFNRVKLRDL